MTSPLPASPDASGRARETSRPERPSEWSLPAPGSRRIGGVRLGVDGGRRALFVHGVPGSSQNVCLLDLSGRAASSAGVSLVAIDRPGIGRTSRAAAPGAAPATIALAAADDMARVLDGLGWPEATVVVHSAGAHAGVTMAARHADRVSRLVLVAAAAPDLGAAEAAGTDPEAMRFFDLCRDRPALAGWAMRAMRLGMTIAAGPATRAAARGLPAPDRALLEDARASEAFVAMIRRALSRGPHGVVADARAARGPWSVDAPAITCPVDVYAGGEDRNVPPGVADGWLARLPHAQVRRLPEAGHVSILPLVAEQVFASIA